MSTIDISYEAATIRSMLEGNLTLAKNSVLSPEAMEARTRAALNNLAIIERKVGGDDWLEAARRGGPISSRTPDGASPSRPALTPIDGGRR